MGWGCYLHEMDDGSEQWKKLLEQLIAFEEQRGFPAWGRDEQICPACYRLLWDVTLAARHLVMIEAAPGSYLELGRYLSQRGWATSVGVWWNHRKTGTTNSFIAEEAVRYELERALERAGRLLLGNQDRQALGDYHTQEVLPDASKEAQQQPGAASDPSGQPKA